MQLRQQLIAITALCLTAGLGAGVSLNRTLQSACGCPHRKVLQGDASHRLGSDLNLTTSQQAAIEELCHQGHVKLLAIQRQACRQLAEERQLLRDGIRTLLTPEQRLRFDELCRQQDGPRSCCVSGPDGTPTPDCPHLNKPDSPHGKGKR